MFVEDEDGGKTIRITIVIDENMVVSSAVLGWMSYSVTLFTGSVLEWLRTMVVIDWWLYAFVFVSPYPLLVSLWWENTKKARAALEGTE